MVGWPDAVLEASAVAQATLALPGDGPEAYPCTDCSKLNAGNYCAHYQRVLPEPSRLTLCVHFERRLPDVPWPT